MTKRGGINMNRPNWFGRVKQECQKVFKNLRQRIRILWQTQSGKGILMIIGLVILGTLLFVINHFSQTLSLFFNLSLTAWLISVFAIIFFVLKLLFSKPAAKAKSMHHLKQTAIFFAIFFVLSMVLSPFSSTADSQSGREQTVSKSIKTVKQNISKGHRVSHKHYDFDQLSLGMSKKDVISAIGKPTSRDGDTFLYGSNFLYFADGKLENGSPKSIKDQYEASYSSSSEKAASEEASSESAASSSSAAAAASSSRAAAAASSSQAAAASSKAAAQQAAAQAASRSRAQAAAPAANNTGEQQYVDANGNGLIKGSVDHIYHIPGSTYYSRTHHVVEWFKTVSDAVRAGYRAPLR
ncbi:MAG: hypothetical protein ABF899_04360 [Oenococcus sp.]